jgi:DNA mismatch endonuclease (patch repair protein)
MDIVDPATRSRMMSGIRSENTKPEMLLRRALHKNGFRYRLHDSRIPGMPDLVFPKYHAVLFVHGCFWHGHDCPLFRMPETRNEFWKDKIRKNRERDTVVRKRLEDIEWRLGIVWECSLKGKKRIGTEETVKRIVAWLGSDTRELEIRGVA